MAVFEGFSRDFFNFYRDLEANNNREWFNDNKQRYTDSVVTPMLAFITDIAPRLEKISPHYRAIAKAHGGSMFRIYRDTRFSRDKTPYKTHAAAHFRHEAGKSAHAPGFYVHIERNGLYFGGGIWTPPGDHLALIRDAIVDNPAEWNRIKTAVAVKKRGGIKGEGLKRPPRGFDPDHRHIEDLKRKSLFVMAEAQPELAGSRELLKETTAAFRAASPLNRFITEALSLPY